MTKVDDNKCPMCGAPLKKRKKVFSDDEYVIMRRGYFYRPNAMGYTKDIYKAWLVPFEVAQVHENLIDEVPVTIHKAVDWLERDH